MDVISVLTSGPAIELALNTNAMIAGKIAALGDAYNSVVQPQAMCSDCCGSNGNDCMPQ